MATAQKTDAKAGWSSYCRGGDFDACKRLSAKCQNPRHGPGGQAYDPAARPRAVRAVEPPDDEDDGFWVDELPEGGRGGATVARKYAAQLARLKERPDQWGRVVVGSKNPSGSAKSLTVKVGPKGYEFTARQGVVYGRYVGTGATT